MVANIIHHDGSAVVFFQCGQFDVMHGQAVDMADEEAPGRKLHVLRELGIGFGHLGYFVQFVKADMGIMWVTATREDNFNIFQGDIFDLAVFQSDDTAR